MKITNSTEQLNAIATALKEADRNLFKLKYCSSPLLEAQSHLEGLTHYVDSATLRFHGSRVNSCAVLANGLLLKLHCTDAMDMHNTKRGHRVIVFDVFGKLPSSNCLPICLRY